MVPPDMVGKEQNLRIMDSEHHKNNEADAAFMPLSCMVLIMQSIADHHKQQRKAR